MKALHHAKQIVYGSEKTLMFTYDQCMRYKDKPGIWLEAGVAAGAHIIVMAEASNNNQIYALDSFSGIPLCSNRDNQMPGIRLLKEWEQKAMPDPGKQVLESSGATVVSEDDFWINVESAFGYRPNNIKTVKGWFELTVPVLSETIDPISIMRLDGDLFHSTWVCLQYLFPKCLPGALIIIDDIQLPGCKAATDEYFELIDYSPNWEYVSNIAFFYK